MNNTLKKRLKKNSRKKKGGQVDSSLPESLTGTELQQNTSDDIDDIIEWSNKDKMSFKNTFIRIINKILEKIKNYGRYNGGKRKTVKRKNKKEKKTLRYKKNKN